MNVLKKTAVVFILFLSAFLYSQIEYSVEEALKVYRLIEKVEREQVGNREGDLRSVVVTESELNSYIAFRIEAEKEEILKELQFKIFKDNKIEGKFVVDLKSQNLPKFLRPKMAFYFGGILEVDKGFVRLDLKDLYLESKRIQQEIIDVVIFIGSRIQNTEPFSIEDWMELPYGIKDIKTRETEAHFYY